jgi:hypothetical protein
MHVTPGVLNILRPAFLVYSGASPGLLQVGRNSQVERLLQDQWFPVCPPLKRNGPEINRRPQLKNPIRSNRTFHTLS